MIVVEIDSKKVDLMPDTRLSLTLYNQLFNDDDIIPGDYSLPFELPTAEQSPNNAEIFKHPDVLEGTDAFRKRDARLYFDNVLFKKGKIWNRQTGETLSANFTFGLANLREDIKTKKLRDLMEEVIVIDNTAIAKKIIITPGEIGGSPYNILVNKREYSATTLTALRDAINNDVTEPRASCVYNASSTVWGAPRAALEISPYTNPNDPLTPLQVDTNEDNGNEANGYKWWVASFDMSGYWNAFNTFFASYMTSTPDTDKFRIPFMWNTNLYGGQVAANGNAQNGKSTDYVNLSLQTGQNGLLFNYIIQYPSYGTKPPFTLVNRNSLQPFVMLKYVMAKASTYFNLGFEGDWLTDADYLSMLIDNAWPLDVKMPFIGKTDFVFWARSFNLKDLVPDITFLDLLKALQNRYNLSIRYNEKTNKIRIVKRKAIAESVNKESIDAIASVKSAINDLSLTGMRFESDYEKNDLSSQPDFIDVGTPELTIKSSASGLSADVLKNDWGGIKGPTKSHPVKNDFKLRIFYYKGIVQTTDLNYTYPSASVNAAGYDEKWAGTNGLYNKVWLRWAQQRIRRKSIELTINYELADLMALDMELKKRYDRNDYFIYSLEVEMTMKRINPVKAVLYHV